jgi:hypothetical protein
MYSFTVFIPPERPSPAFALAIEGLLREKPNYHRRTELSPDVRGDSQKSKRKLGAWKWNSKNGAGPELPVKLTSAESEPRCGTDFGHKDRTGATTETFRKIRSKDSLGCGKWGHLAHEEHEEMVELVGIEPTTSSLRTMASAAIM